MCFCSQLCSWSCHMFAARDNSLCVSVARVSVHYSPVQLVQNILPHFLKCLGRAVPWAPGIQRAALTTLGWAAGEMTETRCLIPQVGLVAPGHQMGMGIYSFPSLFLGLRWMDLQALSPYRPVSGSVDEICCSAALLCSPRRTHSSSCLLGWTNMCYRTNWIEKCDSAPKPYPSNW